MMALSTVLYCKNHKINKSSLTLLIKIIFDDNILFFLVDFDHILTIVILINIFEEIIR